MKITFHLYTIEDENLGYCELLIYRETFQKKEKALKKWLGVNNQVQRKSVIQTQGPKYAHTATQLMKMLLKVNIYYDIKNVNEFIQNSQSQNNQNQIQSTIVKTIDKSKNDYEPTLNANDLLNKMRKSIVIGSLDKNIDASNILNQVVNEIIVVNPNEVKRKSLYNTFSPGKEKNESNYDVSKAMRASIKTNSNIFSPAKSINSEISNKINYESENIKHKIQTQTNKDENKILNTTIENANNPLNMSMMHLERKSLLIEDFLLNANSRYKEKEEVSQFNLSMSNTKEKKSPKKQETKKNQINISNSNFNPIR